MSSLGTSSPVSASTFRYLIRWPVCRLSWLKEIFSLSDVAGKRATGQVTRDSRTKTFQFARGGMITQRSRYGDLDSRRTARHSSATPAGVHRKLRPLPQAPGG